ncbi:response regulator receiver protein, partial [Vibrio ichthyoenteri ATCC 700023]
MLDKKVLIADDSIIVISSVKNMLIKIGFNERNILSAKSVRVALSLVKSHSIDVVISDYNFGAGLNGKQFYEEIIHYDLIKSKCVFIVITGDSSKKAVRMLTELKPDDYILKPFNAESLKHRLFRSIKKKDALHELFALQKKEMYEKGLDYCENLSQFHPEYKFLIEKFKGEFLTKLSLHDKAKKVYQSVLETKDVLWAKIGYANSLANLGDMIEADKLLDKVLELDPYNIDANISKGNLNLLKSDIPLAIKHYDFVNSLTFGNSERELVLVNLCLAQRDYAEAINRYDNYLTINKDTYRDNVFSRLNKIRTLLYACSNSKENKSNYTNLAKHIVQDVLTHYKDEISSEIQEEINLIIAHIALESKQYGITLKYLKQILSNNKLKHFYSLYQLNWLFDLLCCESEFSLTLINLTKALQHHNNNSILSSKMAMVEQLI